MCEIVNNEACGKQFQYCRTHKVEPKDCPKPKETSEFTNPIKGKFKAGDKVRITKQDQFSKDLGFSAYLWYLIEEEQGNLVIWSSSNKGNGVFVVVVPKDGHSRAYPGIEIGLYDDGKAA